MNHEVTYTIKVEVEKTDDEEQDRRYEAYCDRLSGCRVHAGSEKEALSKIKKAIDLWIDFADNLVGEDAGAIEERIDSQFSS
jgi:predicted RNase H-like HicB family nuclease